jgi:hypothetical protein
VFKKIATTLLSFTDLKAEFNNYKISGLQN